MAVHRVLVIEDDPLFSQCICIMLVRAGYDTLAVSDGLAALDAIQGYQPHVIFLDMRLPILDGWGFLQKYRDQPGVHKPIIASSAGNVDPASLGNVVEFFGKPFRMQSFLNIVGTLCSPLATS